MNSRVSDDGEPLLGDATQATAEERSEMKAYGRQKLICHLVDTALDVTTLAVIAFVLASPLDRWLESLTAFQVAWVRLKEPVSNGRVL